MLQGLDAVVRIAHNDRQFFEVVVVLEVEPELRAHAEGFCEPRSRVGCDGPLAQHDLIDAPWRHADGPRESALQEFQWLKKLGRQKPRPDEWARAWTYLSSSFPSRLVIVHDLNVDWAGWGDAV